MNAPVVKTLHAARGYMLSKLTDLTDEQWTAVPEGFSNNILWNIGHLLHSHNGMTYARSGIDTGLPEAYEGWFKGGTSPADWSDAPDVAEVRDRFQKQMTQIVDDYGAGKFSGFGSFELMPGYALETIEDVLAFIILHEGLHIEAITYLRKAQGI
jgi:hypothetical protein